MSTSSQTPRDRLMAALAVAEHLAADAPTPPYGASANELGEARLHFHNPDDVRALAQLLDADVRTRPGACADGSYVSVIARGVRDGITWEAWARGPVTGPLARTYTAPDGTVWRCAGMDAHTGEALWALADGAPPEVSVTALDLIAARLAEQAHQLDADGGDRAHVRAGLPRPPLPVRPVPPRRVQHLATRGTA